MLHVWAEPSSVNLELTKAEVAEIEAPGFIGSVLHELNQSDDRADAACIELIYRYLNQDAQS